MGRKYYTSFLLDDPDKGKTKQFNGVVEVSTSTGDEIPTDEVQAMLAQNFQMDASHIDVLLWSRLH